MKLRREPDTDWMEQAIPHVNLHWEQISVNFLGPVAHSLVTYSLNKHWRAYDTPGAALRPVTKPTKQLCPPGACILRQKSSK